MLKRLLAAFVSVALLAWLAFHAWIIVHLVQAEVIPALAAGTFNIRTNSTILNRVWEGNELYWFIAAHAMLVAILAIVITQVAGFAIRGGQRLRTA